MLKPRIVMTARIGSPPNMDGKRILIAEDDDKLRRMYGVLFAKELSAHAVDITEDGREALALMEQNEFDLVISDLNMPTMDGRELYLRAQELRAQQPRRKMPRFIFCSGVSAALDDVAEFCAEPGNRMMLKPFPIFEMKDAVEEVLSADNG